MAVIPQVSSPHHVIAKLIPQRAGGRVALGSDFPVESIDPLKGFYAAVTRLAEDGSSPSGSSGWRPDEQLTREQALRGFTIDGPPFHLLLKRATLIFLRRLCFLFQRYRVIDTR